MKKFLFSIVCAVVAVTASATSSEPELDGHTTCCGIMVTTVDEDAFDCPAEAKAYYKLLDEIFCGSQCD